MFTMSDHKTMETIDAWMHFLSIDTRPELRSVILEAYMASNDDRWNRITVDDNRVEVTLPSPEVCSRIVGRKGCLVRELRARTQTIIGSPKIEQYHSSKRFEVRGTCVDNTIPAFFLLFIMNDYFEQRIADRYQLEHPSHTTVHIPISADLVPYILYNNGNWIRDLRQMFCVNIVSPKPYSDHPHFTIIGHPGSVNSVKHILLSRIYQLTYL